jgi:hypothetical protein
MGDRREPLQEIQGDELIAALLFEIEEEERLSQALGVDLTPPAPDARHAPLVYGPLDAWLKRSEEIHEFRASARRAEAERGR